MRSPLHVALVGLALLLAACEGPVERADLEPVPHPEIEGLESAVAETIRKARARVDVARYSEDSSARELAEAYGHLGMTYQVHDFQAAAGACYRNALRLQSDEPRWAYYLAHVYLVDGALEKAIAASATGPRHAPRLRAGAGSPGQCPCPAESPRGSCGALSRDPG
ncbi:MAG: hypothetical protein U5K43_11050 [Halofilum sp. (in: g-proteobacteria)]|nr:hypothetical protein [Halofilum sp. (in: g-proteobacteria)]